MVYTCYSEPVLLTLEYVQMNLHPLSGMYT